MIPIEICLSASMLCVLVLQSQTWMRTLKSQMQHVIHRFIEPAEALFEAPAACEPLIF